MNVQKEKPIAVYDKDSSYLSHCTKKRAAQMVYRHKAKWIGENQLQLVITKQDEKEIRRIVGERDKYKCYICDEQLTPETVTYDHIIPRIRGGEESIDNLACCCSECNELKASMKLEEFFLCLAAWVTYHKLWYTRNN